MGTATRNNYSTKLEPILDLALELGDAHWKLGFTTGFGQKPRLRTIGAGDIAALDADASQAEPAPSPPCFSCGPVTTRQRPAVGR